MYCIAKALHALIRALHALMIILKTVHLLTSVQGLFESVQGPLVGGELHASVNAAHNVGQSYFGPKMLNVGQIITQMKLVFFRTTICRLFQKKSPKLYVTQNLVKSKMAAKMAATI